MCSTVVSCSVVNLSDLDNKRLAESSGVFACTDDKSIYFGLLYLTCVVYGSSSASVFVHYCCYWWVMHAFAEQQIFLRNRDCGPRCGQCPRLFSQIWETRIASISEVIFLY